ncbi:MAG: hypothetical protein N2749_00925 [Clostridia bacterium]|nr:hypothetical protein [Clostridia bacterium]
MNEFEDRLALIQIIGKAISPVNYPVPTMVQDSFLMLLDRYMCTPYNMARLKERVLEIYQDRMLAYKNEYGYIPDVYEIADFIDEENMEIIRDFYSSYQYTSDEIDIILGNYIHGISYGLSDIVTQILLEQGLPFIKGLSELSLKPSKKDLDSMYKPQIIMFYEMCY